MSPFWKNVTEELQYQGMNLKTLSYLTGVPYSTLTNSKNRADSIPTADVALKISKVLNKPLERLLNEKAELPQNKSGSSNQEKDLQKIQLFNKYELLINSLERFSNKKQDAIIRMFQILSVDE